MSVRLMVRQRSAAGGHEKPSEVILADERITLGRDPKCQVVLSEPAVSRTHARIIRDGALYFIEDLGSSYGTQVNGAEVPKGEKRLLRVGDVIAIAQFDLTFDTAPDTSQPSGNRTEDTAAVARQAVKGAVRGVTGTSEESPYLRFMNGPREGERVVLTEAKELIIGRDEAADLLLTDDLVSRQHVKVRRDWMGTHVGDLGSRNGIRVNRRRVTQRTLKDQDELEVGDVRLLYIDPGAVQEAPKGASLQEELEETRRPGPRERAPMTLNEALPGPGAAAPPVAAPAPLPPFQGEPSGPVEQPPGPEESLMPESSVAASAVAGEMGSPIEQLLRSPQRLALLVLVGLFALGALTLIILLVFGL